MTSKADRAVNHILLRIIRDPQFAWVMVHTESLGLLLEAQADAQCVAPEDYADFRAAYMAKVKTEDVRGKILAEDWENAAHNLIWAAGRDAEFEALRERAEREAEERRS